MCTCSRPPLLPCGERERASRDREFRGLLLHIFAIHHTRESHIIAVAGQREAKWTHRWCPFASPSLGERQKGGARETWPSASEEKQGLRVVYCSQVVEPVTSISFLLKVCGYLWSHACRALNPMSEHLYTLREFGRKGPRLRLVGM